MIEASAWNCWFSYVALVLRLSASDPNLLAAVYSHSLFLADDVLKQYKIRHTYNGCYFSSIFFYVVLVLFVL